MEDNKVLLLSAYLFAMLNPSISFDYGLRNHTEMFFSQYEKYFQGLDAFKPLFNKLLSVQGITTTGFSPAAIALLGSAAESEAFIDGLKKEASIFLVVQSPKTRMKALPLLYNNCFTGQWKKIYVKSTLHRWIWTIWTILYETISTSIYKWNTR